MAAAKTGLHDFDLWIEPGEAGYRARARWGDREESSALRLDFSDPDLAQLHEADSLEARELGGRIFRAAFSNEILALYRACRKESQYGLFRLILHLPASCEPARWPWELLWDDREGFLALSSSVVRWQESSISSPRPAFSPPLRLLVAIAQPRELPPLSAEEPTWIERTRASNEGRIEIEVLRSATLAEVERRLQGPVPYHLFHFLGHGRCEAEDGNGVLCFETEHGRTDPVDSLRLSATLRRCASLRLAVLNACEGALAVVKDPVSGLAHGLVHLGIPRVIAVQGKIFDRAAACFSDGFYSALTTGASIESALTVARSKMNAAPQGRNWGLPVLLTSVPDETLLVKQPPRWLRRLKLAAAVLALPVTCLTLYLFWREPPFPPIPPPGIHDVECADQWRQRVVALGGISQGKPWRLPYDIALRGTNLRRWRFHINRPSYPQVPLLGGKNLHTKGDDTLENNLKKLPACLPVSP